MTLFPSLRRIRSAPVALHRLHSLYACKRRLIGQSKGAVQQRALTQNRISPLSFLRPVGSAPGILEPSVAQPPLPLQEFLALHPLSLDLQPPLPLHEFLPLQACFSLSALSAFLSVSWAVAEAFPPLSRLEA
jgi:hypothetical protein